MSTEWWLNKVAVLHTHTHTHTQLNSTQSKKKESNLTIWDNLDLEGIILSEINQSEKTSICMISLICGIYKTKKMNKQNRNRLIDIKNKLISCSWIQRINIVKVGVLPKAIHRLNVILIKLPRTFTIELKQVILTFIWNNKRPCKSNLQEKEQSWRQILPELRQ